MLKWVIARLVMLVDFTDLLDLTIRLPYFHDPIAEIYWNCVAIKMGQIRCLQGWSIQSSLKHIFTLRSSNI